jgi:hypothetical protein
VDFDRNHFLNIQKQKTRLSIISLTVAPGARQSLSNIKHYRSDSIDEVFGLLIRITAEAESRLYPVLAQAIVNSELHRSSFPPSPEAIEKTVKRLTWLMQTGGTHLPLRHAAQHILTTHRTPQI